MKPIYPGMKARMSDGSTATVTDVLIDRREHAPRLLVLSANGYFGPDVVAPFSAIWRVDDEVHLSLSGSEVAALPHFNLYEHCHVDGLSSRSAWRYGADRRLAPGSRPRAGGVQQ
jgi:hypothetical protein